MKIPNWGKITWWLLLIGFFAYLFGQRYDSIIKGTPTSTDIVILLVFIVILVIPLFQEFSIFGVSFKKEIENLKTDIDRQIVSLKSEIRNTVNIYPYGIPPSDAELPNLKKIVDEAVRDAFKGKTITRPITEELRTPDNTQFLFAVRYQIENELRQISRRFSIEPRPHSPTLNLLHSLEETGIISRNLFNSIREIYSICSAAIHGEDISEAKVNFVREVAPELISYLKNIESRIIVDNS